MLREGASSTPSSECQPANEDHPVQSAAAAAGAVGEAMHHLKNASDCIRRLLAGRFIVKYGRAFSVRESPPRSLSKGGFYLSGDAVAVVALPSVGEHIDALRSKGEGRGLIPANRAAFDVIRASGIELMRVDSEENRWAVIPEAYIISAIKRRHKSTAHTSSSRPGPISSTPDADDDHKDCKATGGSPARMSLEEFVSHPLLQAIDDESQLFIIGRANTLPKEQPVLILSVAEAALKSKIHASEMINALARRVSAVVDKQMFKVVRRGDHALHVVLESPRLPLDALREHRHRIDVKLLALIPGIAKIYDPASTPRKVEDAALEIQRIDTARTTMSHDEHDADDNVDGIGAASRRTSSGARDTSRIINPTSYRRSVMRAVVAQEQRRREGGTVYGEVLCEGAGGIPIISSLKSLCLLSGGIDSPVAAYAMMTRGCHVDLIHFLNSTSDTAAILHKIHLIAKRLSSIQGRIELTIVDIASLQQSIVDVVDRQDRTVVYKQFMLLLAAALEGGYRLLVTGDSVAQVASQTVHNIATLYPLVPKAVISPLSGTSKSKTIALSTALGLFDASTMKGADCCQYLMCKTGATLCIGERKMRRYLQRVALQDIPTRTVTFENGKEIPLPQLPPQLQQPGVIRVASVRINVPQPVGSLAAAISVRPSVDPPSPAAITATGNVAASRTLLVQRPSDVVYLDSAAASIIDPLVAESMMRVKGNPNSVHAVGRACRAAVEGVRHQLLSYLCPSATDPFEVVFTSGGTEANNIALHGLAHLLSLPEDTRSGERCILYSSIAHPSIVEVVKDLQSTAVVDQVVALPVSADGLLSEDALETALRRYSKFDGDRANKENSRVPSNILLAVDLVNHELGVVQNIDSIVRVARTYGALVHVDACQALCKVDFDATLFDSVSVTAHKINGPIGVGAVAVRAALARMMPKLMKGGSYDGGLRPGTLNAPGIVGLGTALSLPRDNATASHVFDALATGACNIPGVRLNSRRDRCSERIAHLTLLGAPPAVAVLADLELVNLFSARYNIMLSTGAACSQSKGEHLPKNGRVSDALYRALNVANGPTLRVSIDHHTTLDEIQHFLQALREVMGHP